MLRPIHLFKWLPVMGLSILFGCADHDSPENIVTSNNADNKQLKQVHFLKQHHDVGFTFAHKNSMQGDYWPHEILGPGAGVLDFDGDGDLDIYFRQGSSQDNSELSDQLFLNQWNEIGQLKFINATEDFDVKNFGYGMGVTFGDIDNDGDADVFLTNFGADVMLENQSGKLVETTGPWQTDEWSTSATFVDINRDGWLDLYVGKYNQYQLGQDVKCYGKNSQIDYCSPKSYPIEFDSLYLNQEGVFVDVSESSGIKSDKGYTLGVVVEDFNGDGWPDILTANDATKNFLWINQQDGTFKNEGLNRGIAVNGKGQMEASMGIGIADFDFDLDWDIIMTHLTTESNTLYVNNGESYFMDRSSITNMVQLSKAYTAFGVGWLDVNNDYLDDLIIINGAVNTIAEQRDRGDELPLKQKQQVLLQQENLKFDELQDSALEFINKEYVGRAAVFADFDNDGDKDFVVTVNHGPPLFIENQSPQNNWIGLDLRNRNGAQALGSVVYIKFNNGSEVLKRYHNDGSYLSGNDPRILARWGGDHSVEQVKINWPDGETSVIVDIQLNQYLTIKQNEE